MYAFAKLFHASKDYAEKSTNQLNKITFWSPYMKGYLHPVLKNNNVDKLSHSGPNFLVSKPRTRSWTTMAPVDYWYPETFENAVYFLHTAQKI